MVRYIILLTLLLFGGSWAFAQTTGSLQGKVIDEAMDEAVMFANVVLEKDGSQVAGTSSDMDGNYNFSNIEAGSYDVLVSYVGFATLKIEGVRVKVGQTVKLDLVFPKEASGGGQDIDEVIVTAYKVPLIEQDNTTGGQTLSSEDIQTMSTRDVGTIAATTAGVNQQDEGEAVTSNGSRSGGNDTYIDGVRVIGNANVSADEIDQIQIITTGVPVEFGDATGAITNIITKGPSGKLQGGVFMESSQYLDNFGANRVDMYFSGPIIAKPMLGYNGDTVKVDGVVKKQSILGYRVAGSYYTTLDSRPSALGSYRLKDEKLAEILANPLVFNPNSGAMVLATDNLTEDDLLATNVRPNNRSSYALFNGKLEFKPSKDFFFVVGGNGQFDWGRTSDGAANRLINFDYNTTYRTSNWRVNGRFRHDISATKVKEIEEGEEKENQVAPVFQNFSYEFLLDYSQRDNSSMDPRYNDRLWEYGYVGKFYRERIPVIQQDTAWVLNTNEDTVGFNLVEKHTAFNERFTGFDLDYDINPGLAAYNNYFQQPQTGIDAFLDYSIPSSILEMEIVNGAIQGNRSSAYGLFNSPHLTGGASFGKFNQQQIRGTVKANFDLVSGQKSGNPIRHSISLGGVYEQRISRNYSISPFSLWNLADLKVNEHIANSADQSSPTGEQYFDPITNRYYDIYNPDFVTNDENGGQVQMSQFGARLRDKMNLNSIDWVNVHEMTPDQMELEWFEPTSLITGGNRVMSYYGYDYLGNPLGTNVNFNDFFTGEENGVKTRKIAPIAPIYVAGYIQDKFSYKDLICRVGFRFDSYDANTKVLKDPYSIAGFYNASEFESSEYTVTNQGYTRPSTIGDDYAVYVSENSQDAAVVGYRSGDQWFDAEGTPVNSPNELGSTIVPALRGFSSSVNDTKGENYDPNQAFVDYKPTTVVMPRIAFSFPISDEANFYANYDVLARRPDAGLAAATPYTYYNFRELATANNASRFLPNANLRSQRTINYEVGFQQKLTDYSKFKVSMLYREERDLIQTRKYVQAYPITYETYGNDDFSTIKSFKFEYDMRAYKNFRILANYTLQFAEGTGSSPTSSVGLAAEELKNIFPLSFDQRHSMYVMFDYRFKGGKKYDGPVLGKDGKFKVFENMGFNLTVNASSGRPYTRKQVPGAIHSGFSDQITEGSINGARMPWNYRLGLRIDRSFVLGKKDAKNKVQMNVYLRIQNLLNTQNVMGVYRATGSPVDDGFLASDNGVTFSELQAASYQLLYNLRMENPYNISRPRRIFIGVQVGF